MDQGFFLLCLVLCFPLICGGWLREVRNIASLPVIDYGFTNIIDIRLSALFQLSGALGDLSDEVLRISPSVDSKDVGDVLGGHSIEDGLDVCIRVRQSLRADHSL